MALNAPTVEIDSPDVRPTGTAPTPSSGGVTGLLAADEPLGRASDLEFRPLLAGGEFSTSLQSAQEIVTLEAPRDEMLILDEISVSLEDDGQTTIAVSGEGQVTYTGAVDITLPFNGAYLPDGKRIRIFHQSTDGTSTTTKVSVTGRRV